MADNGGDDRKSDEGTCTDSDDSAGASNDSPETDQPTPGVSLSLDATLELLAHSDRRAILDYLLDAEDSTATVGELADYLVAKKAERTGEQPGHDHVLSTLHHVHIPKLADSGVVDYDPRTKEVRYWGSDRLETWHERIQSREDT
ncbi:winged helix-turn-helix domain-containing protein [Halorussus caseinilyticus]|uniref:winged helix-turn-helix domain-containing protein n=1 Tax=Halorussus caseinilyticus TaxID=3034025 RepID=UPI0023E78F5E|nr:winged helix-turn-helix domain-containing protein [Halorussus sp. DT72]